MVHLHDSFKVQKGREKNANKLNSNKQQDIPLVTNKNIKSVKYLKQRKKV